jgi:hypothetical protein
MGRRIGAALGIVLILGLALLLLWRVYIHHERTRFHDDPVIVSLNVPTA